MDTSSQRVDPAFHEGSSGPARIARRPGASSSSKAGVSGHHKQALAIARLQRPSRTRPSRFNSASGRIAPQRLHGLTVGARSMCTGIGPKGVSGNDAVGKPFSYGELRHRIAAVLRRANGRRVAGRLRVGALELDPASRDVRLRGHRIDLSQKEFALLQALAAEPTRVLTKVLAR